MRFELRGKVRISFYALKRQPIGFGMVELSRKTVESDDFQVVDYAYPQTDDDLVTFKITTLSNAAIRNGYYYAPVAEEDVRKVHLALATTTFKKEAYITHNVSLFKNEVKAGDDPCAGHVSMIVVDNGRTLDPAELEGNGVWVYPNKNVGDA